MGRDPASCSDLLSYLLFTSGYTKALIDIGYHDANDRIDEIEEFLFADDKVRVPEPSSRKRSRS